MAWIISIPARRIRWKFTGKSHDNLISDLEDNPLNVYSLSLQVQEKPRMDFHYLAFDPYQHRSSQADLSLGASSHAFVHSLQVLSGGSGNPITN